MARKLIEKTIKDFLEAVREYVDYCKEQKVAKEKEHCSHDFYGNFHG